MATRSSETEICAINFKCISLSSVINLHPVQGLKAAPRPGLESCTHTGLESSTPSMVRKWCLFRVRNWCLSRVRKWCLVSEDDDAPLCSFLAAVERVEMENLPAAVVTLLSELRTVARTIGSLRLLKHYFPDGQSPYTANTPTALSDCSHTTSLTVSHTPNTPTALSDCSHTTSLTVSHTPNTPTALSDCSHTTSLTVSHTPNTPMALSDCSHTTSLTVSHTTNTPTALSDCSHTTSLTSATHQIHQRLSQTAHTLLPWRSAALHTKYTNGSLRLLTHYFPDGQPHTKYTNGSLRLLTHYFPDGQPHTKYTNGSLRLLTHYFPDGQPHTKYTNGSLRLLTHYFPDGQPPYTPNTPSALSDCSHTTSLTVSRLTHKIHAATEKWETSNEINIVQSKISSLPSLFRGTINFYDFNTSGIQ